MPTTRVLTESHRLAVSDSRRAVRDYPSLQRRTDDIVALLVVCSLQSGKTEEYGNDIKRLAMPIFPKLLPHYLYFCLDKHLEDSQKVRTQGCPIPVNDNIYPAAVA